MDTIVKLLIEALFVIQKHGQYKVECLDEMLLSPVASANTTPTFVTPDSNWLLGTDPFGAYHNTSTYSSMQMKMLCKCSVVMSLLH